MEQIKNERQNNNIQHQKEMNNLQKEFQKIMEDMNYLNFLHQNHMFIAQQEF